VKLPEIGSAGQEKLRGATVLAVGVGGLGCASLPWLVRAGIGNLVLMDPGIVDLPDLGRQLLYREADMGLSKVTVAAERLRAMNPDVEILAVPLEMTAENVASFGSRVTLILDGTDAMAPRRVMNAFGVRSGVPVVFGGAVGWAGMAFAVSKEDPCWECAFGHQPASMTCDAAGVIGPAVGWVGALQANLALQLLLGRSVGGVLFTGDLLSLIFRKLRLKGQADCPVCGAAV
jgi:molybdopterin/thiamine biosynthesis adenylyltransferase